MNGLKLGVAREIITPVVGGQLYGYRPDVFSECVEDDLHVTAFYFEQGETKALMLSAEVCLINTALAGDILFAIEKSFGIPKENCMLCATHTHSGPNTSGQTGWGDIDREYCENVFIPAVMSATKKATEKVTPVKMAVSRGVSLVGINRRELDENNKLILGQNPWGAFDPEMTVISFADGAGKVVANMVHYGAHGTSAGANHEITRDWSGAMIDALEGQSGGVTAFFNGPEGDVGPRLSNKKTVGDITYVHEMGEKAAKDALEIYGKITEYKDTELSVSHKILSVPLKKRISEEEATALYEEFKEHTVNRRGMMRELAEKVLKSYGDGYVDKEAVEVPQTVIMLGDIVFAAFPYELFSEIGMRIDRAIGGKSVLSLSNTNGSEGYFITKDAVCRGGYEVQMFLYGHLQQYDDDADFYLMKECAEHIKSMTEGK